MFLTNITHGFGFTESCTQAPALLYPSSSLSALVHHAKLNQIHMLLVTPLDDVWNFIMLYSKLALMYLSYFIMLCLLFLFIFLVPTLSVLCDQELHQSSRIESIVISCLQDQGLRQLWNYCQCCGHAF